MTGRAAPARRPWRGWRLALLLLTLACFVGLVAAEAFHHHDTVAAEESCVLCQAATHPPLDATPAGAALAPPLLVALYVIARLRERIRFASPSSVPYRSRAPPHAF